MAASKKQVYYLLPIFLCIHLSAAINVEEFCAKRCLHGRGGVLCNCNAMHFNGKRSGVLPIHAGYLKKYNTQRGYNTFPENYIDRRNPFVPDTILYDGSLNSHGVRSLGNIRFGVNSGVLEDPWNEQHFIDLLRRIRRKDNSDIFVEVPNGVKEVFHADDSLIIPLLLLKAQENDKNIEDGGSVTERRKEVASTIKEIMAAPLMILNDSSDPANVNDDLIEDTQEDHSQSDDSLRQHVIQLQDILRQVHQRR